VFLAALLVTPLLGSLLFGVAPWDPLALTLAAVTFLSGALGAAWLASFRALPGSLLAGLRGE
jgi:hypothetical protein